MRGYLLVTSLLLPCSAQTVTETQHAFEAALSLRSNLKLTLHSRLRTDAGSPYQLRAGPVFDYAWRPYLSFIGGYYATAQRRREQDIRGVHRFFAGADATFRDTARTAWETRSLVERFLDRGEDYNRYRNRVRFEWKSVVTPYSSAELFLDARGVRSVRLAGGLRLRASGRIEIDSGYFYEPRRTELGPTRHMVTTTLHFRTQRGRRADPDL